MNITTCCVIFTIVPQISLLRFYSVGLARATWLIWSLIGGIREPGWAKSPPGDVWVWLRLELGNKVHLVTRRRYTGWVKSPAGDAWVGLRLELARAN